MVNQSMRTSSRSKMHSMSREGKSLGLTLEGSNVKQDSIAKDLNGDADSIKKKSPKWDRGEKVPWLGCVCGLVHPRPSPVFWVQCDGTCHSWYNVAVDCVGFSEADARTMKFWFCPECSNNNSRALHRFWELPIELVCHTLDFVAPSSDQAGYLCCHIALLCKFAHYTVHSDTWSALWMSVLRKGYPFGQRALVNFSETSSTRNKRLLQGSCSAQRKPKKSRNLREKRDFFPGSAIEEVRRVHLLSCDRTDDAHMSLSGTINSKQKPLTLKLLRTIFMEYGSAGGPPIRINRVSQSGRGFLVECCAADYVDERVILRCVRELIEGYGADPNLFTKHEHPYADCTPIYFAIARVLPTVVEYLIHAGASVSIKVSGRFHLVSDSSKDFFGTYTPLSFAKTLKDRESEEKLPQYYMNKLNTCIDILSREVQKPRKLDSM